MRPIRGPTRGSIQTSIRDSAGLRRGCCWLLCAHLALLAGVRGAEGDEAAAPRGLAASLGIEHPVAVPSPVRIWEEPVVIPTYRIGPPDPNPMFYTRESYQGAQKRVYPYPLQDDLLHLREDRTYKAVHLENRYIKLCVLPELGGRLFSAVDKTNRYDFFYRQHVIKPALIGMLGAWISGGIEWCAFHHHRNSTFMPVDYALAENRDGSKTIWVGETERRHRMKWLVGLTLYPGKSYIEATVRFFNRTAQPHSILYWANVAVHVTDDYQVIFPPSVQVATYHSKIDFTHWPISRGRYRGHDYSDVDISWWKSSPVSNSFFAWNLQEDFMGGYDHGKHAGVVHVANHHVVCGAKLWEWGTGSYGQMWDGILTDDDGPYAELMVGAFSDNQPDYSWIKPHEVKSFRQFWYPVREIGGFKNANLEGAVNLELKSNQVAAFGFHTTSKQSDAKAILEVGDRVVFEKTIEIGPGRPFRHETAVAPGAEATDLRASLISAEGRELVSYQPAERIPVTDLPEPVKAPPRPEEIKTVEELYLTGLRIEQIHNPSLDPAAYYEEALRRDPGDSRTNTIMGAHYNRRGLYEQAEQHLRRAIERISREYTRPADTEPYYQLGLALRAQGKIDEAYDSFYRATWDYALHSPAHYQLAEISCRRGDFAQGLRHISRCLRTNALDTKALGIKACLLRKLGRTEEAKAVLSGVLRADPLDFFASNELALVHSAAGARADAENTLADLERRMRGEVQSYLELAVDYMNCGLRDEAIEVLLRPVRSKMDFAATFPLVYYYLGYLHEQKGDEDEASEFYREASRMPSDYCFPFRLETKTVLDAAIRANSSDAHALYYLGNLLYDIQPENAIACWEESRGIDKGLATVHRNLGWAYLRSQDDVPRAIECYEGAISCNQLDPRLFLELDILYELGNVSPQRRLAVLEKSHSVVLRRKESFLREIVVLVLVGQYDRAIEHLANNYFHVREGGGEIHDVYVDAHLLGGIERMKAKEPAKALYHFQKASEYPENLSVGRPKRDRRAPQVAYYTGTAHEALGNSEKGREFFRKGAEQRDTRGWPETQFYQGMCHRKIGEEEAAARIFDRLIETGKRRLARGVETDFFAKFGGQERKQAREASARFVLGLGLLGKGRKEAAREEFQQAAELDKGHVWAKHQLSAVAGESRRLGGR